MTFPYLKQKYQIPGFYIDVPYEKNQDSIRYVADQLREMKKFLEDVGGKKISEQSVQRAVANSNEGFLLQPPACPQKGSRSGDFPDK